MPSVAPGGSIIVTLFEGEPYTLWNVQIWHATVDYRVERVFRFQASAYRCRRPAVHRAAEIAVAEREGHALLAPEHVDLDASARRVPVTARRAQQHDGGGIARHRQPHLKRRPVTEARAFQRTLWVCCGWPKKSELT